MRTRLLSRAPPYLFEEIRAAVAAASGGTERELSRERDFGAARQLIAQLRKDGALTEAMLLGFARQKRYEETVAALAALAQTGIEIVRPLMQSLNSDGILVPCKVAGLGWETVGAILDCRFSTRRHGRERARQAQGAVCGVDERERASAAETLERPRGDAVATLALKSRDTAVQIVCVRALDLRRDDLADPQRPPA